MQQLKQQLAAQGVGHVLHGDRVVEVAPGRHDGQQQVMPDRGGNDVGVGIAEAKAQGHVPGDDLAGDAVVAGPALAHVMQQAGKQ